MVLIEPEFEIDEKNRVICKFHSDYLNFIDPTKDYFEDIYLDKIMTCLTCSHYTYNECYFTKSRIEEIEFNWQKRKVFRCQLCIHKIERMFTIIYKLYNKEKYGVEIPLICCNCYDKINTNQFLSESKKLKFLYFFVILTSIFSLFYLNFLLILLKLDLAVRIFLSICFSIFILLFIVKLLIVLKRNIYGVKYYKKHFMHQEATE